MGTRPANLSLDGGKPSNLETERKRVSYLLAHRRNVVCGGGSYRTIYSRFETILLSLKNFTNNSLICYIRNNFWFIRIFVTIVYSFQFITSICLRAPGFGLFTISAMSSCITKWNIQCFLDAAEQKIQDGRESTTACADKCIYAYIWRRQHRKRYGLARASVFYLPYTYIVWSAGHRAVVARNRFVKYLAILVTYELGSDEIFKWFSAKKVKLFIPIRITHVLWISN